MANIDIDVNTNTYEKIKSQGLTILSKNDTLNEAINTYFDIGVESFNRGIAFFWERYRKRNEYLFNNSRIQINLNYIAGIKPIDESILQHQMIEFINEPQTKYIIDETYQDAKSVLRRTKAFKAGTKKLVNDIHKELSISDPMLKPLPKLDTLNSFE